MNTLKVETFQYINLEYEYAGVLYRILARVIDILICYAYIFLVAMIMAASYKAGHDTVLIVIGCILALPVLTYTFFSELLMQGQTLGKKAMKIKVISLKGGPVSVSQYLLRWLFLGIDLYVAYIGLILIAVTDKNQRLGDIVAGTTCISLENRSSTTQLPNYSYSAEYRPVFLNVTRLSDADVQLVKEVYETAFNAKNQHLLIVDQASEKLRGLLGLQGNQYSGPEFLKAIIMDYTYLSARNQDA